MSVMVYRDSESIKVEPEHLGHYLSQGWSTTRQPANVKEPEQEGEGGTAQSGSPEAGEAEAEHTNAQVRDMAQLAGIPNAATAKIKTLRKALGLPDEQA